MNDVLFFLLGGLATCFALVVGSERRQKAEDAEIDRARERLLSAAVSAPLVVFDWEALDEEFTDEEEDFNYFLEEMRDPVLIESTIEWLNIHAHWAWEKKQGDGTVS